MKDHMTSDERELYDERVSIMLAEFNPAGLTNEQVESATVDIEITAREQILQRRQRAIDTSKSKKQTSLKFGG